MTCCFDLMRRSGLYARMMLAVLFTAAFGCATAPRTVEELRERSDHFAVRVEGVARGWQVVSLSHLTCRGRCRDGEAFLQQDYLTLASGNHDDWLWTFTWPAGVDNEALLSPETRDSLDAWIALAMHEMHQVLAFVFDGPPPGLELWVHFVPDDVGLDRSARNFSATRIPLEFWHRLPMRQRAYSDLAQVFRGDIVQRVFGSVAHEYAHVWLRRHAPERGIPVHGKNEEVLVQTLSHCVTVALVRAHLGATVGSSAEYRLTLPARAFEGASFPMPFPGDEELAGWWQRASGAPYNHYLLTYPLTVLGILNMLNEGDFDESARRNRLLAMCRGMFTDPVDLDAGFYPEARLPDSRYFGEVAE